MRGKCSHQLLLTSCSSQSSEFLLHEALKLEEFGHPCFMTIDLIGFESAEGPGDFVMAQPGIRIIVITTYFRGLNAVISIIDKTRL